MILNVSKTKMPEFFDLYTLPNKAVAIIDMDNKLVAYNKNGEPDGNNWDWVRKDCKVG
jgi:hypothetical protein